MCDCDKKSLNIFDQIPLDKEIVNFDKITKSKKKTFKMGSKYAMMPNKHAIFCGQTGAGKTNLALSFLIPNPDKSNKKLILPYRQIFLLTPSDNEDKYNFLKKYFNKILDKIELKTGERPEEILKIYNDVEELPELKEFDKGEEEDPRVFIIDDFVFKGGRSAEKITEYYIRARKCNFTCLYICQKFTDLPDITLRRNAKYFFIFPFTGDNKMMKELFSTVAPKNMIQKLEKAVDIISTDPKHRYNFITIDKNTTDPTLMYRLGLKFDINKL